MSLPASSGEGGGWGAVTGNASGSVACHRVNQALPSCYMRGKFVCSYEDRRWCTQFHGQGSRGLLELAEA
jgi:hypothetical protein